MLIISPIQSRVHNDLLCSSEIDECCNIGPCRASACWWCHMDTVILSPCIWVSHLYHFPADIGAQYAGESLRTRIQPTCYPHVPAVEGCSNNTKQCPARADGGHRSLVNTSTATWHSHTAPHYKKDNPNTNQIQSTTQSILMLIGLSGFDWY